MSFGISTIAEIQIYTTAQEAAQAGHIYRQPRYEAINLDRVVIIRRGTQNGLPTIDLVFKDQHGQEHVNMITGRLLAMIVATANGAQNAN